MAVVCSKKVNYVRQTHKRVPHLSCCSPCLPAVEEGLYYVVKMAGSGSVCVVNKDQLLTGGGEELVVGARCEVGEEGGVQSAVIIGAGQFPFGSCFCSSLAMCNAQVY